MLLCKDNETHLKIMRTISETILKNAMPLALKGGTALLLGYGLEKKMIY